MINNNSIHHCNSSTRENDSETNSSNSFQVPNVKIINEAVKYLDQVKYECEHNPQLYHEFFEYMSDHKSKKLTSSAVITGVSQLFHNHPDLIIGFNAFVPPGYEINIQNGSDDYSIKDSHFTPFNSYLVNQKIDPGRETKLDDKGNTDDFSNYLNNIQRQYIDKPEVYQTFLKYLVKYNKDLKILSRERDCKVKINELQSVIHVKISNLFKGNVDLISEFERNLNKHEVTYGVTKEMQRNGNNNENETAIDRKTTLRKRSMIEGNNHRAKRKKTNVSEVSITDAAKYGRFRDNKFFDDVKKALHIPAVYENFLRCISLYNNDIADADDLVMLVKPFLGKYPELFSYFKYWMHSAGNFDELSPTINMFEIPDDQRRLGETYLPLSETNREKCSGRDELCLDVLNDTFVSFPTSIEESNSLTSKKNFYEERIMRVEDERYELDVVIDSNLSTILTLESVKSSFDKMSPAEMKSFRLDDKLGGNSETVHKRSIKRVYGELVGQEMIEALKSRPIFVVSTIIQGLRAKDEEWKREQRKLNKHWAEQCDKYYWKSLDHQFISFKQNDVRNLKPKILINEIEANLGVMEFSYQESAILKDGAHLIMHQVKKQFGINRQDKTRIRKLLSHFLSSLFFQKTQLLSDDEGSDSNEEIKESKTINSSKKHIRKNENFYQMKQSNEENYKLFFCNDNWYLFLRLYTMLSKRLNVFHKESLKIIEEENTNRNGRRNSLSIALKLKPNSEGEVDNYYQILIEMIKRLLDGFVEHDVYEDKLHNMFGVNAYIAFTMDKVIAGAARQLHYCVFEKAPSECMEIFLMEKMYGGAGGPCKSAHLRHMAESRYQKKIEKLLKQDNCYKIAIYKMKRYFSIEIMKPEEQQYPDKKQEAIWSTYVEKLAQFSANDKNGTIFGSPVFLRRNIHCKDELTNKACVVAKLTDICNLDNPGNSDLGPFASTFEAAADPSKQYNTRTDNKTMKEHSNVFKSNGEWQIKQGKFKLYHVGNRTDFLFREKIVNTDYISSRKHKYNLFLEKWTKMNVTEDQLKAFAQCLKISKQNVQ